MPRLSVPRAFVHVRLAGAVSRRSTTFFIWVLFDKAYTLFIYAKTRPTTEGGPGLFASAHLKAALYDPQE